MEKEIANMLEKARVLSEKSDEYFRVWNDIDKLLKREMNLIGEMVAGIKVSAEVPESVFEATWRAGYYAISRFRAAVKAVRGEGNAVRAEFETENDCIIMNREGRGYNRVYTRNATIVDILVLTALEKHGKVVSKIIEEVEKRNAELAETYRTVATLLTVVEAMLR
jgi:3-dehydroquinate synthase class II